VLLSVSPSDSSVFSLLFLLVLLKLSIIYLIND